MRARPDSRHLQTRTTNTTPTNTHHTDTTNTPHQHNNHDTGGHTLLRLEPEAGYAAELVMFGGAGAGGGATANFTPFVFACLFAVLLARVPGTANRRQTPRLLPQQLARTPQIMRLLHPIDLTQANNKNAQLHTKNAQLHTHTPHTRKNTGACTCDVGASDKAHRVKLDQAAVLGGAMAWEVEG